MATAAHPPNSHKEKAASASPEQALCDLFDVVEDALGEMAPDKRKAWLEELSATAETLDKQA